MSFRNEAELMKRARLLHPKRYSQSELSHIMGYKNGQFVSNIERALCGTPTKSFVKYAKTLNIDPEEVIQAKLKDKEVTLREEVMLYEAKEKMASQRLYTSTVGEAAASFNEQVIAS